MPITPAQAAEVARRHGLSLLDASGLLNLADTAEEADAIAATFAQPDNDNAARAYARELFASGTGDDLPARPEPAEGELPNIARDLFRT